MTDEQESNFETCKQIAQEIEAYRDNEMYRCPECNNTFQWDDENFDEETAFYVCPICKKILAEHELESLSIEDYLSTDEIYDIEYRVDAQGRYRNVELMIAGGGPNIYIDTADNAVKLYWAGSYEEYPISPQASAAINAFYEERYNNLL